jgi:putative phosphoesterase
MDDIRIGLISDTHGLLRPEAQQALQGVSRIVHAGDIGSPAVLEQLGAIAPVVAVRGNNDRENWADPLPETIRIEIGGVSLYLLHDLNALDLDPRTAGIHIVVAGHSHKPSIKTQGGVLYVNPGSAGPRRFKLPVSLAFLEIKGGKPDARIHILEL